MAAAEPRGRVPTLGEAREGAGWGPGLPGRPGPKGTTARVWGSLSCLKGRLQT